MRMLAMLVCAAVAMLAIPGAHAATTAQVVDTWPSGDTVTLGPNQNFYVHLRYHSDKPTHFWAQPYGDAGPVHAGTNPSRVYPAGDGEAMVWFFFRQPGETVNGIRIRAGDGTTAGTHVVVDYPVQVFGGDESAPAQAQPEWLTRLSRADKAAQDAAYQHAMHEPVSTSDMLMFNGFMLLMAALGLIGFLAPAWGLWRWRGGWRIASAIPAAVMAFVVLRLIVDTARDPTSHNLWPFEILMAGVISTAIMLALMLAHKVSGARRTS